MAHHPMNKKKHLLRGAFAREKSIFLKKNIWSNFLKIFFAHLMRNFFLIPKWSYFLSFAQNFLICEGLQFSLLKMENFPFSGVSAPGTP